jgi:peroxiredoxin
MSRGLKEKLTAGALLVLAVLAVICSYRATRSPEPLPLNAPIPAATFLTPDGTPVSIRQCRGKKVVMTFFSVDCGFCQSHLRDLASLYSAYKNDIEFIGISLSENRSTLRMLSDLTVPFTVLLDHSGEATREFRIESVPAVFLVDENQILRFRYFGEQPIGQKDQLLFAFVSNEARLYLHPTKAGREATAGHQPRLKSSARESLRMIFESFQISPATGDCAKEITLEGTRASMLTLKRIAECKGLKAEGWRYSLADLVSAPKPAIVFIETNHFAVVDSVSKSILIYLRDPWTGHRTLKKEEFEAIWDGRTLVFSQAD